MAITLIQGLHLTARDKQIIAHMIAHDMASGQTSRATVQIETKAQGLYSVAMQKPEKDDWGRRRISTVRALVICDDKARLSFPDALALRDEMSAAAEHASNALQAASGTEKGPMGLTPDYIKARPEWRGAYGDYNRAAASLRAVNGWILRHYKTETRVHDKARREERRAA